MFTALKLRCDSRAGDMFAQHYERHLSRSIDVELRVEDVVDDRLTQIVHNVAVAVLQRQSVHKNNNTSLPPPSK